MSLQKQVARAEASTEKYRKMVVTLTLERMDIAPDSEVGKFTLENFKPAWASNDDVEAMFNRDAIFDWLSEFTGDDHA